MLVEVLCDTRKPNPVVDLVPFGRWALRDKAAQRQSPLLQGLPVDHTMIRLLIDIPSHIDDDEDLAGWVRENPDIFSGAMDLDAYQIDERATVHEVTITDVKVDEKTVAIHYEYDFSAYYGCRDINQAGTSDEDVIVGARQGNTLSFDKFKSPERRSTFEEL